jgi:hypothetical protein
MKAKDNNNNRLLNQDERTQNQYKKGVWTAKETSFFFDPHTYGKTQIIQTHRLQNKEQTVKHGFFWDLIRTL